MGAGDQAETIINDIIENYSNHDNCYRILNSIAKCYRANNDYARCISLYQQVMNTASRDLEKHEALAGLAKAKAHSEGLADTSQVDAIVDYMVAIKDTFPRVGYHMFQIGEEYGRRAKEAAKQKNKDAAENNFKKAISVWSRNINDINNSKHECYAYYHSGVAYLRIGHFQKAIDHFNKLLRKYPEFDRAWNAQFQIVICYDKMYRNKQISLTEVKSKISEVCNKYDEKYPDFKVSASVKKYSDKYSQL